MTWEKTITSEIFLNIMSTCVPNLLLPTHPEEIHYQDRVLMPYLLVCKAWKELLDKRFDFKTIEQLFVGTYNWPSKKINLAYENHCNFLKRHYEHDPWFVEQKKQNNVYKNMMLYIDIYNYLAGKTDINGIEELKESLDNGFYSPLYFLLPHNSVLWQKIFAYRIQNALNNNEKSKIISICIRQYCLFVKSYSRLDIIEKSVNKYCDNLLDNNFFQKLNKEQPLLFDFYFQRRMQDQLQQHEHVGIWALDSYIKAGGFIYQSLSEIILNYIYSDVLTKRDSSSPYLKALFLKIVLQYDPAIFLATKLQYMIQKGEYIRDQNANFKVKLARKDVDYRLFLLHFYNGMQIKTSDDFEKNKNILRPFFREYKEWFLKQDREGKPFLYSLLLCSLHSKSVIFLLKMLLDVIEIDSFEAVAGNADCVGLLMQLSSQGLPNYTYSQNEISLLRLFFRIRD